MAASTPTAELINGMSAADYKVYENRLRRMADRQGLRLEKSRRRDHRAVDYCTYQLVDNTTNTLVCGDSNTGYGISLDDIERALTEEQR